MFIESEHPRDSDGKFTDGIGKSKAEKIEEAEQIYNTEEIAASEKTRRNSCNVIPNEILERCKLFSEEEIKKSSGWLSGLGRQDDVLKEIIKARGFDAKPQVVTLTEIENLIKNGCMGFTRGMKVDYGTEQYISGEMYVGRGTHGSGVYVSCFTNEEKASEAVLAANTYATDKITGKKGSVLYGAIKKDTKIIKKSELDKIRNKLLSQWDDKLKMLFGNNGKLAAALGYDMIDCENDLYYIVLNRGKTIVGGR